MSDIRWAKVNDEPYEYAIAKGPVGDEFLKLTDGACIRRPAWQPIETAPKDGPMLAYNPVVGPYQTFRKGEYWPCHVWGDKTGLWFPEPTHWMPLPNPPTKEPNHG